MINVRTEQRLDPGKSPEIQNAVAIAEGELADKGRVVLRASGTEPVIRVMVEGLDLRGLPRYPCAPFKPAETPTCVNF
jgi:phosphoglucosamine mutase